MEAIKGKAKFKVRNAFFGKAIQELRDLDLLATAIYKFDSGNLKVEERFCRVKMM
jgi:hypothetical protein